MSEPKFFCVWFIGPSGPVRAPPNLANYNTFGDLYNQVPAEFRYVLGFDFYDGFTCWDVYQSKVHTEPPFAIAPHFVDKFEDMDHALAALTINYEQDTALWRKRAMAARKLRFRARMET